MVCGPRLNKQPYSDADIEFGAGLVAQAAVSFDNAWHFQDYLVRQQMEKEIAVAAAIQRDLFPASLPSLTGCDIAAQNRQAKLVGATTTMCCPFKAAVLTCRTCSVSSISRAKASSPPY